MNQWLRVGLFALAVAGIVGLGIHYDSVDEANSPYPSPTDIQADYGAHVGEQVFVFGHVEALSPANNEATIRVETDGGSMTLAVSGFDVTVQQGGTVQVFGRLEADQRLAAANVVVVNPSGSSTLYKYAVSAVGALVVLGQFFRYWRTNTATLAFEVRDDG